jgi:hypothetical protein
MQILWMEVTIQTPPNGDTFTAPANTYVNHTPYPQLYQTKTKRSSTSLCRRSVRLNPAASFPFIRGHPDAWSVWIAAAADGGVRAAEAAEVAAAVVVRG